MKTYQIIGKSGITLGTADAITPAGALNKYAQEKGFESWGDFCLDIHSPATYKVILFKILVN